MEQDRLGWGKLIDVIDQVRQQHINAVAHGDQVGKPYIAPGGPIDHGIGEHARLAEICHPPCLDRLAGIGSVEFLGGHDQAHAFRAQHPDAGFAGRAQHALANRSLVALVAVQVGTTGQYQRRFHTKLAKLLNQLGHALDGRTDDGEIGNLGKVVDALYTGVTEYLIIAFQIDRPTLPPEATFMQVAQHQTA